MHPDNGRKTAPRRTSPGPELRRVEKKPDKMSVDEVQGLPFQPSSGLEVARIISLLLGLGM